MSGPPVPPPGPPGPPLPGGLPPGGYLAGGPFAGHGGLPPLPGPPPAVPAGTRVPRALVATDYSYRNVQNALTSGAPVQVWAPMRGMGVQYAIPRNDYSLYGAPDVQAYMNHYRVNEKHAVLCWVAENLVCFLIREWEPCSDVGRLFGSQSTKVHQSIATQVRNIFMLIAFSVGKGSWDCNAHRDQNIEYLDPEEQEVANKFIHWLVTHFPKLKIGKRCFERLTEGKAQVDNVWNWVTNMTGKARFGIMSNDGVTHMYNHNPQACQITPRVKLSNHGNKLWLPLLPP